MTDSWSSLEGVTFAQKFQIQTLLHEDGSSARFLTRIVDGTRTEGWLWLSLISEHGERALRYGQTAAELSHPNLLETRETGTGDRGVTSMAYVLTEPADENLASILKERPLDQVEAREALLAIAKTLKWLHSKNLVHGKLEPANILAVGDQIKLASATIEPFGEGQQNPVDADIKALGQCVHAMFTQTSEVDLERLSPIPQPFRDIVRGCCAQDPADRWTAQRVINVLNWQSAPSPAKAAQDPAPVPVAAPLQPVVAMETVEAPEPGVKPARSNVRRLPAWALALAWVAAALLIVLVVRKAQSPRPAPPRVVPPIVNVPERTPPPAPVAGRATVAAPEPPKPSPTGAPVAGRAAIAAPEAPKPSPTGAPVSSGSRIWRVVSYTYSRAEDAARMVGEINRKFPQLRAERFLINEGGPYLVALGGRMTYGEAVRLRERAIAAGLPSDTFVRNFKK